MEFLDLTLLKQDDITRHRKSLEHVQGYCLVSHGRDTVLVGLLRFVSKDSEALSQALAKIGCRATNAYCLYSAYATYKAAKASASSIDEPRLRHLKESLTSDVVIGVGLSSRGYERLKDSPAPLENAFQEGFAHRFKKPAESRYDAIIVLAGNDPSKLEHAETDVCAGFNGLAEIEWKDGFSSAPRDQPPRGGPRDHLGFPEDISQPVFFDIDMPKHSRPPVWDPSASLHYVLIQEPGTKADDAEYGSHMAFVNILTDVQKFNDLIESVSKSTRRNADDVKSWLLGRRITGEPLVNHGASINDFNYDDDKDFTQCPAASHIRKMNPRSAHLRNHRVFRRSVLYEENGIQGVLFQCFQSKLETGFEHLFNDWGMAKHHPGLDSGVDPLLGGRECPPLLRDVKLDPECPVTIQAFTEIKGGEYFYFPSVPFFGRLDPTVAASLEAVPLRRDQRLLRRLHTNTQAASRPPETSY